MQFKRVVVTGIGALTPIGNTAREYWDGLANGVSGADIVTKFDPEHFKTKFACEVKGFNIEDHIDRREARRMDPYTHYAMVVADEAMIDSGLEASDIDPDRAGVIWGSGIGGLHTLLTETRKFIEGGEIPRLSPFFIPMMISDIAAGYISIKYGLRGPNFTTVSACASSNNAIMDAFTYIREGRADIIVTGGSEACVNELAIGGFSSMKALSGRNDDCKTASRPFDKDRDGFVLGEGGASLILEDLDHALARGAKIYCEVMGAGMSADAYHITAPHPEGLGASHVMQKALADAKLTTKDIDYINVHGTSTPLGDISETRAVQTVFGEDAYDLNISSTKSMTGHLLGAAGAVEALACIMAIYEGVIPPTINHFTNDEQFDPKLNFTFNKAQKKEVNAAMSNTFGFGGHNVSVVLKKYEG